MAGLGTQDCEAYRRDGYLCPIDIFDADEAAAHRAALEDIERNYAQILPRPVGQYLRTSSYLSTDVPLRIARDPGILDKVESILGPDILMWSCEYFIKEARTPHMVSWHQDLTYWGMDGTDHEVTAWVALSPATATSGAMKFVPGSHKGQIVPHEDTFAADNLLSRGQEIAVEVERGGCRGGGARARANVAPSRAALPRLGAEQLGRPAARPGDALHPARHALDRTAPRLRHADAGRRPGRQPHQRGAAARQLYAGAPGPL